MTVRTIEVNKDGRRARHCAVANQQVSTANRGVSAPFFCERGGRHNVVFGGCSTGKHQHFQEFLIKNETLKGKLTVKKILPEPAADTHTL